MKIPTTVKIGAIVYDVFPSKNLTRSTDAYAQMDPVKTHITFDPSSSPQRQEKSFIHELFEAMNQEYDMKLKHHQIELLGSSLYMVIVDNPGLFDA